MMENQIPNRNIMALARRVAAHLLDHGSDEERETEALDIIAERRLDICDDIIHTSNCIYEGIDDYRAGGAEYYTFRHGGIIVQDLEIWLEKLTGEINAFVTLWNEYESAKAADNAELAKRPARAGGPARAKGEMA